MTPALRTDGLDLHYGAQAVVADVALSLAPGARHALIGPNGAGKTSLVNLLAGTVRPEAGRILLGGRDVTALPPERRARLGLGRTFQVNQLFATLTPAETLTLAGDGADPAPLLDRFGLTEVAHRPTAALAYGQQRLLEIATALATRPRVLLLDEPAAGLPEAERRGLIATLAALPAEVAVLLIEHDIDLVMAFAARISVMVAGRIIAEGAPAEIMADARVRAAYLGTRA